MMPKKKHPAILIKVCITTFLISVSYIKATAQASPGTVQQAKKPTYLLPDGRPVSLEKWDSLEQAWGKGRIILQHNAEDDAKGVMHLVRLTDEMIQQAANRDQENEKALIALLGKAAPAFELTDLDGKQWSLEKLKGIIVVLNFWFTSCAPCIREMPELNKLVKTYHSREIVFLAITFNDANQTRAFQKKYVFDYTLIPDSKAVIEKYRVSSYPTSMIIDQHGNLKKIMHSSPKIGEELRAAIDDLLQPL